MNVLGLYKVLKENGVPDSQIVLMIGDEYATNSRNPFKNAMYANGIVPSDTWYNEDTELDFRGSDVTVENFMNAALGVGPKSLQQADENSNVIIFVTGHGGDQFFKFQDEEEVTAQDISNLLDEMQNRRRFNKLLFIADTCQAFTLFDKVTTPNVYALGTSLRDENAYAHHSDTALGLSVIERWTHGFLTQYRKRNIHPSKTTLHDLMVAPFEGKAPLGAHVGVKGDFKELLLRDFFGTKILQAKSQSNQQPKFTTKWTPTEPATLQRPILLASSTSSVNTIPSYNTHNENGSLTIPSAYTSDHFGWLLVGGSLILLLLSSFPDKDNHDNDIDT
eukprot:Nitzschia sp. Nitz4//scaffold45_size130396//70785//71786//NITZ4_003454-RA/size130396-processed-gene-0.219-mRNA-1//-1//CDS//3329552413//4573//frame0